MIPRILVPRDVRPVSEAPLKLAPQRTSSTLDERTLVPSDLPVRPLDGHSSIPSHVPLDVLTPRTLVPRNLPVKPLEDGTALPSYLPLQVLDSRVVVPRSVDPVSDAPMETGIFSHPGPMPPEFADVLEPDLFTTGEVNLLADPIEERGFNWHLVARVGSVIAHVLFLLFLLVSPKLFPNREPTAGEMDLARKELNFIYMPPSDSASLRPAVPATPRIHIDRNTIRRVAPSTPEPPVAPPSAAASQPQPELPSSPAPQVAPTPHPSLPATTEPSGPVVPQPRHSSAPLAHPNLNLPSLSPGRELEQSVHQALKGGGSGLHRGFGDVARGSPGSGGNGSGGSSYLGGNLEMLTPTDGVDFSDYFARLLATVKQNWYAVIPESARLGDQGIVVIQFHIERDGTVPNPEPDLTRTSGKEPLDRAAMAAIRASSPFEPLPPAFTRPSIELRFTFLYNIPLNSK